MRKCVSYLFALLSANFITVFAFAQSTTITGNAENSVSKEKVPAVSVTIKGATAGTFTDDKGNFKITTNKSLPLTLIFSSIGYDLQEYTVTTANEPVQVELKPSNSLGQDVVIAASRVPQKILESPVSIERVSAANIRSAPVANFYDVVLNLKGVDVTTSSLTFKTPTTRGFNSSGNTRFNQLVDGMDNQAPGLNFSVSSIIGISELDVDNLELLAGASSALYGPGGMNGTLLMTSKNPFKYQGLSFLVKEGVMNTDKHQRGDVTPYHNWNVRWAKKLSEKFAFKVNAELVQATDWLGEDYRDYNRIGYNGDIKGGDRQTDPNYDGVNVYGDETTIDIMKNVLLPISKKAPFLAPYIYSLDTTKPINVSRTGYTEKEIINPNTVNFKLSGSLHYKITPSIEAVLAGYWGTGNTIYTGNARYSLKDFKMGQYKFELIHKNWTLRTYTTQENAGESYNAGVTTQLFNESWKPSGGDNGWYAQYGQTYLAALLAGVTSMDAHTMARSVADVGRPAANSDVFRNTFEAIRKKPIPLGGLLLDKSDLYSVEGNYNLSYLTHSVADIIVGANYRKFVLNSEGTLFADTSGLIDINEYGMFIQATRDIAGRLKLTLSGRYDKNENFKGRFTPRATAVIKVAENNNIRLSYQTAYRFPSTQQQWINLNVGGYLLIGSNPAFKNIYHFNTNPVYSLSSLQAGSPELYTIADEKPESVSSFEAGYKGLIVKSLLLKIVTNDQ